MLEETYEVLAALDADDEDSLREELGDLLLQIVLHTQIATDEGELLNDDVIDAINSKIIRRHPHVWGQSTVANAEAVVSQWEQLKKAERQQKGENSSVPAKIKSLLDSIPTALPALAVANLYGARSAKVGFDWPDVEATFAKVQEEIGEVQTAPDTESRAKELGDVLFSVAQWTRHYGVEPETVLREANARWAARFRYLEARANGDLSKLDPEQLEALWREAKAQEVSETILSSQGS